MSAGGQGGHERDSDRLVKETEYLRIYDTGPTESGKTWTWAVANRKSGGVLGQIRWYPPWRRYCYFPRGGTVLSAGCMRDVVRFITRRMQER